MDPSANPSKLKLDTVSIDQIEVAKKNVSRNYNIPLEDIKFAFVWDAGTMGRFLSFWINKSIVSEKIT